MHQRSVHELAHHRMTYDVLSVDYAALVKVALCPSMTDPRNEYRKDQQATLEGTKSNSFVVTLRIKIYRAIGLNQSFGEDTF